MMKIQTIKIKCPKCGLCFEVTNTKGEAEKRFNCPSCGKDIIVRYHSQDGDETHLGGQSGSGDTQTGDDHVQLMSCHLILDGIRYDLQIGENRVGRKASEGTADIKLETKDRSMSREHAIINVRRLPNGGIKTDITNWNNKNATCVNGYELGPDDAIVLKNKDCINMGDVTITFHTN